MITLSIDLSDHEIITITINTGQIPHEVHREKIYTNYLQMKNELQLRLYVSCAWRDQDLDAMYGFLRESIIASKNFATARLRPVAPSRHQHCPWLDSNHRIIKLIKEKQNLWKRYKRGGRVNESIREKLRAISNLLTEAKRTAKKAYFHTRFTSCSNSMQTRQKIGKVLQAETDGDTGRRRGRKSPKSELLPTRLPSTSQL